MDLSKLSKLDGKQRKAKRRGRGVGSGKGAHTVGFGMKGQKSRTGNSIPLGFEGGQIPLYKRLPYIGGFKNPTTKQIAIINLSNLNSFRAGSEVTPQSFVENGTFKKLPKHGVKILGKGKVSKKLKLSGFTYSASATEKLEAAGCTLS